MLFLAAYKMQQQNKSTLPAESAVAPSAAGEKYSPTFRYPLFYTLQCMPAGAVFKHQSKRLVRELEKTATVSTGVKLRSTAMSKPQQLGRERGMSDADRDKLGQLKLLREQLAVNQDRIIQETKQQLVGERERAPPTYTGFLEKQGGGKRCTATIRAAPG